MSTKLQTSKNILLTNKFIEYFVTAKNLPDLPNDISFVAFSSKDKKLNKANQELLENLMEETAVAMVEEPKKSKGDWNVIPVNF